MTVFRASKGYHFSEDGTPNTTWAKFEHVQGSDPSVYEFETTERTSVAQLRKLIEDEVGGYTDIVEVAAKKPAAKKAAAKGGDTGGSSADGADTSGSDPTAGAPDDGNGAGA